MGRTIHEDFIQRPRRRPGLYNGDWRADATVPHCRWRTEPRAQRQAALGRPARCNRGNLAWRIAGLRPVAAGMGRNAIDRSALLISKPYTRHQTPGMEKTRTPKPGNKVG